MCYYFRAKHTNKTETDGGSTVFEFCMYSYVYACLLKSYTLINPLRTKLYLSNLKTQFVPHRKLSASVIKPDKLLLYTEKFAVFSEIHTKYIVGIVGRIQNC